MELLKLCCTGLFLILFVSPSWSNSKEASEVKIGILATQGIEIAIQKWQPTADYLNQHIPGYRFSIVPMDFDEIPLLVDKKLVDFVIVNSSIYVDLSVRFGLRHMLTLKNRYAGRRATEFGSVIFTRSDNQRIFSLKDLTDSEISAVHATSFGGWLMALRELDEQDVIKGGYANIHFENSHNAVVKDVISRAVDAGIVRTDTLERLQREGKLELSDIRVLNEQSPAGFPLKISTRLYPEWPMAKLEHTSSTLAQSIAIALMRLPEQSQAAISADIAGWTIPENYQLVHDILRQLKLPPYEHNGEIPFANLWASFGNWIVAVIAVVLLQSALMLIIFTLNKRLCSQRVDLSQSEERFKATFEQAAVGILHASVNGELLRVNQKFCKSLGYSETEILKFNLNDLFDSVEISDEHLQLDRMRNHEIDEFTYQKLYNRKDGSQMCGLTTISCIRGSDEAIKYLVVVVDDVSAVVQLEQKIIKQQKQNQLILDLAGDGILGLDVNGLHTYVNPAAARMFGWKIHEMIGKDSHHMWHHSHADGSDFSTESCPITQVLIQGKIHRGVNEVMWRKDGSSFLAEYISTPIYEDDSITGAVVVVRGMPTVQTVD